MSTKTDHRHSVPFHAPSISALARSLRAQLEGRAQPPGHVELLNALARSVGFRNYQHLHAQSRARAKLEAQAVPPALGAEVDYARLVELARPFDAEGRLARWPSRYGRQGPCMWVLWSRLPARITLRERELGERLRQFHTFGDHALLRRELVNHRLVGRTDDGSAYWRIERAPTPEALALIRLLAARAGAPPVR